MSASLDVPQVRKMIAELQRRVGILERRVSTAATAVDVVDEIVFSYAGTLADDTTSPPVRARQGGILTVLAVTLGTAGSTDTTIIVERNGMSVATVVVPDGVEIYNADVGARFVADVDVLTLTVDMAGTGAADMTAAARFT